MFLGKKNNGFTMIEIMVVVVIIGLLALLTVPMTTRFLAKAKRAEAYMNLSSIYTAQKIYWAENGKYASDLASLGWKPEGYSGGGKKEKFYYTYGFAQGGEGQGYVTGNLETPSSALKDAKADKESFVIVAAADLLGKGRYDILTVNQNNAVNIVQDGLQ